MTSLLTTIVKKCVVSSSSIVGTLHSAIPFEENQLEYSMWVRRVKEIGVIRWHSYMLQDTVIISTFVLWSCLVKLMIARKGIVEVVLLFGACRVTGGELFEDIVAREFYSEADARLHTFFPPLQKQYFVTCDLIGLSHLSY